MRQSLLRNATLVVAATIASGLFSSAAFAIDDAYLFPQAPSNNCGWNGWNAAADQPVLDGPAAGLFYTGPYRGRFARVAPIEEANCVMQCRTRPSQWGWGGWQYYTVRVCRGGHVARSRGRHVDVELK